MANLRFEAVTKKFGSTSVLEGFDLEVAEGEFLVVVGPSGCGKSTLLRLLAGLEEPTSGRIWIGDREVQDLAPKERDVAMVFQSYALYPHMTVRRNIAFGLEMRGLPKSEIAERVAAAAYQLGLDSLLDRYPAALSGGQRQRVAVGRAIVRQPKVFLFDEPLSNLDAALRVQMRAELTTLQKRFGITTLYVTHDQVEAMTMGDRVAVMDGGRLLQCAPPRELYERPANLFVARFLGTPAMNLLAASLGADARSLDIEGQRLPLPTPFATTPLGTAGRPLLFGLRPEAVHARGDVSSSQPSSQATLRAHVEFIEELGHESLIHARLAANRLTARCAPRHAPALGTEVELALDLDAAHLFDPRTTRRIEAAVS